MSCQASLGPVHDGDDCEMKQEMNTEGGDRTAREETEGRFSLDLFRRGHSGRLVVVDKESRSWAKSHRRLAPCAQVGLSRVHMEQGNLTDHLAHSELLTLHLWIWLLYKVGPVGGSFLSCWFSTVAAAVFGKELLATMTT